MAIDAGRENHLVLGRRNSVDGTRARARVCAKLRNIVYLTCNNARTRVQRRRHVADSRAWASRISLRGTVRRTDLHVIIDFRPTDRVCGRAAFVTRVCGGSEENAKRQNDDTTHAPPCRRSADEGAGGR